MEYSLSISGKQRKSSARVREYVCTREELNQCKCMRIKYLLLKRMFLLIISRISEHKIGAWANRQYNKCSNDAFRLITRCRKLVDVKRHVIYVKLYAFFCHFITNFPHANFFSCSVRSFVCFRWLARLLIRYRFVALFASLLLAVHSNYSLVFVYLHLLLLLLSCCYRLFAHFRQFFLLKIPAKIDSIEMKNIVDCMKRES